MPSGPHSRAATRASRVSRLGRRVRAPCPAPARSWRRPPPRCRRPATPAGTGGPPAARAPQPGVDGQARSHSAGSSSATGWVGGTRRRTARGRPARRSRRRRPPPPVHGGGVGGVPVTGTKAGGPPRRRPRGRGPGRRPPPPLEQGRGRGPADARGGPVTSATRPANGAGAGGGPGLLQLPVLDGEGLGLGDRGVAAERLGPLDHPGGVGVDLGGGGRVGPPLAGRHTPRSGSTTTRGAGPARSAAGRPAGGGAGPRSPGRRRRSGPRPDPAAGPARSAGRGRGWPVPPG